MKIVFKCIWRGCLKLPSSLLCGLSKKGQKHLYAQFLTVVHALTSPRIHPVLCSCYEAIWNEKCDLPW